MPGGCEVFKEDRLIVLLLKTTFYNIFITKESEYKASLNKNINMCIAMWVLSDESLFT